MLLLKLCDKLGQPLCRRVLFYKPLFNFYSSVKTPLNSDKNDIDFRKPHTEVLSGDTIVCWHPDPEFPYENSRPIDLKTLEEVKHSSVFNKQLLDEDKQLRPKKGPSNSDLREIFYTEAQRFAPRTRENKLYAVSAPIPRRK